MEQDKLPCGPDLTGFDREVFERVWRRVMPEERPDCPITLAGEGDAEPTGVQQEPQIPQSVPMTGEVVDDGPNYPAVRPGGGGLGSPTRPVGDMRAVQPDVCRWDCDVPCLGASSTVHSEQLQEFIDHELADWRTYMALAKRAQGNGGRVLASMAADEKRHAKRLSTAYFLISGVRYWPIERMAAMPSGTYMGALRQRFCEEQRGEAAYLAAAEGTCDPCLHELFGELASEENAHAWLLRGILEQL